jgi:hypothetical protein
MKKFDYKKFLTENKLTKASILREGFEEPKTEGAKPKSSSKDELKAKIKEMIIAELSNDPEDFEKSGREVEYGINPKNDKEEFDLKDFFMDDEEEEELPYDMPGFEGTRDALDSLKIREAKKKKKDAPEEDIDLDLDTETPEGEENIDLNFSGGDTTPTDDFSIDTSAVDPNIKAVQDALTQAQAAAEKIQDEKLSQQIGNTITMFTRTHIANKEPIR